MKQEIRCAFCKKWGYTKTNRFGITGPLLLAIDPHVRKGPKKYACRQCIRKRWKLTDLEFMDAISKAILEKS